MQTTGFPVLIVVAACLWLSACSGTELATPEATQDLSVAQVTVPATLPQDALQPWEQDRQPTALDAASEFTAGADRFMEGGTVSDLGLASRIGDNSGSGDGISYALYRIPLAGFQPGALAFDVNIQPDGSAAQSEYYIGLSHYAAGRWEWHGPYSEHHVRLVRSDGPGPDVFNDDDYTSGFDNLFVNILVQGDSQVDVVGISSDSLSGADSEAPPVPTGLQASPVAGGLLLSWETVAAADLAGYRIHFADHSFISPDSAGVRHAGYVEGSTSQLLESLNGLTYVRITAVDNNGNESAPSAEASALPLAGNAPQVLASVSKPSVQRGEPMDLLVVGDTTGLLFDYDLDGDGLFELAGQSAATQALPTQDSGLLRPRVMSIDSQGERTALGGVSLIVSSNSRPVASAGVSAQSGPAPLSVDFDGTESTDFDGSIVGGGWDFDGDGIYDAFDEESTAQLTANHSYAAPGFYNARLRVIDDEGAWDVDTVGIFVEGSGTGQDFPPLAMLTSSDSRVYMGGLDQTYEVTLDASGSTDPEGGALEYAFDPEGDGEFTAFGSQSSIGHEFDGNGVHQVSVQVRDEAGQVSSASLLVSVYRVDSLLLDTQYDLSNRTAIVGLKDNGSRRIGILYNDSVNDDLRFTYSADSFGDSWMPSKILDSNGMEWASFIQDISQFAFFYYRDGDLFYKHSSNDGTSFGTGTVDDSADDAGNYCSGIYYNDARGNGPAVAYYNADDGDLYFNKAASGGGTGVGSWDPPVAVDGTGDTGLFCSLQLVANRPAIAYYRADNGNLLYTRADDKEGTTWSAPVVVDGTADDIGQHASLALIRDEAGNVFPAIACHNATTNRIEYRRALDVNGDSWGDVVEISLTPDITALQLMQVGDRVMVCASRDDFYGAWFMVSADAAGSDWVIHVINPSGSPDLLSASITQEGHPVFAYWHVFEGLRVARPKLD